MQPNGYAPQYPAQPSYPQYPTAPAGYPQQQYPPAGYPQQYPAAPQYPAQGYPQQPPAPAAPVAPGSLDGYYSQPSTGGGKAWSFHNRPNGTTYVGIVSRPITDGDIQQQTDMTTGVPRTFKNGQPMFVMIVPLLVQPSADFPDGVASWWVRGQARDELVRAMAEAGAPAGPPEAGAMVEVTKVSERPGRPGFNPTYQYRVRYTRPTGAPMPAPQPVEAAPAPQYVAPVANVPQQFAQPVYVAPGQPVPDGWAQQSTYAPAPGGQVPVTVAIPPAAQLNPVPQQYAAPVPAPQAMQAVAQGAPAPAQPAAGVPGLGGLTAEQQALMARLTNAGQ